ncbi:hypothetical protein HYX00_01620 [Candidatus Woesearchaeota archaeon]|nr:hypothetical protein [Candidatus Woesearchaeota archaeon]
MSTLTTAGSRVLARPSGNTVTAVFDEATGLSTEDVFLRVGSSRLSANSCNKQTNWICTWNNVNFGSSTQMSIDTDTADVLGNAVSSITSIGVTIDNQPPILRSINISNIDGLTQAFPGFFKIGDKIEVVANLTEANDVSATADFSKFISGASKVAGSCERVQADENICTWQTEPINLQANDVISFNFSDAAGNTLIATRSLRTFGLENATVPDFWSNEVECSPRTIDRQLGPLINQRVFCQVSLTPKSTRRAVSTVFISPASCTGGSSILQSFDTFNTEVGSTSPIIKLTLKKDEFKINNANLSCSLNIFSRIGSSTTITKNPEIENVKINIEFFNLPLGELDKVTQDKIEQAKKDAEGIWKIIGTLNKLMFYAKKICQLLSTLYNIVALLYGIAFTLTNADIAAQKTVLGFFTITPTAVAGCSAESNTRLAVQSTWQGLNKFCDIVTCKQTFLWGPTVQNWINNAPLLVGPGQYLGPKTEVKGEGFFGQRVEPAGNGKTISSYDYINQISVGSGGKPRPVSEYMDPNHNLIVATLFACLPGIIYGLDKYRQVKCLYADCLQNAVGREGLPVTACEDQKAYATCKYVYSELFAVFPWTAVLDHFLGIIKNALSNPFSVIGIAASIGCTATCPNPNAETRLLTWTGCEYARLFNQLGTVIGNVKNMIDEGFKIRQDYCSRLKQNEKVSQPTEPIQKTSQGSGSDTTTKTK